MRRLIGPLILAALVAASLWFLQSRPEDRAQQTSSVSATPATSTLAPAPTGSAVPSAARQSPTTSASTSATPASAKATPGSAVTLPTTPEGEGIPVGESATATPRDSAQAQLLTGYEKAAVAFMSAFARPSASVSADRWWAAVRPQLTASAAEDYSGTDPQQVPFTRVTGPSSIIPTDAPTSVLVAVRIPTDAGAYRVELQTDVEGIHVARAFLETASTRP